MSLFEPEFESNYPYTYRVGTVLYDFVQELKVPQNQIHTVNPIITISGNTEELVFSGTFPTGKWQDYWVITVDGTDIYRGRLMGNGRTLRDSEGNILFYLVTDGWLGHGDNRALYTRDDSVQGLKQVLWANSDNPDDRIWIKYPEGHSMEMYVDEDRNEDHMVDKNVIVTRNIPDLEFIKDTSIIAYPRQEIGIIKVSSESDLEDKFKIIASGYVSKIINLEPDEPEIYRQSTDTYTTHSWYTPHGVLQKNVERSRIQNTEEKSKMKDIVSELNINMVIGYSSARYSKHRKSNELR